jgi:hypothetical protein
MKKFIKFGLLNIVIFSLLMTGCYKSIDPKPQLQLPSELTMQLDHLIDSIMSAKNSLKQERKQFIVMVIIRFLLRLPRSFQIKVLQAW